LQIVTSGWAEKQNPLALAGPLRYAGEKQGSAAMTAELSPIDKAKYAAARKSVDFIEPGMKLGLGTGSTAAWMVRCLAERIRNEGLQVTGVATSKRTADLARELGVPIVGMDDVKWLDLTIDGADEFDPNLNLIKGGGAALLQEKIVATASDRMIVIADAAKEVAQLGDFPLPVEVVPFGWQTTKSLIEETLYSLDVLNREVSLRMNRSRPLRTDEGNYILDLNLKRIGNPRQLALVLNQIPGVVENGLFIDICDVVVIGDVDGKVTVRDIYTGRIEDGSVDLAQSMNIFADLED
jgi:ribose 5-phosphate isomerase A